MVSQVTSEKLLVYSSRTMHLVNLRSSRCNSPSEALHFGASSMALRLPVRNISEITNTQTHTQNTRINIIDIQKIDETLRHNALGVTMSRTSTIVPFTGVQLP